jgi:hypothetical protein
MRGGEPRQELNKRLANTEEGCQGKNFEHCMSEGSDMFDIRTIVLIMKHLTGPHFSRHTQGFLIPN